VVEGCCTGLPADDHIEAKAWLTSLAFGPEKGTAIRCRLWALANPEYHDPTKWDSGSMARHCR
jgi:hypothetical protein